MKISNKKHITKYGVIKDNPRMNKVYTVMNETDGITASPYTFKTIKEAKEFIRDFIKRYEKQGYYFSSRMERIEPKYLELSIRDKGMNEVWNNQYGYEPYGDKI